MPAPPVIAVSAGFPAYGDYMGIAYARPLEAAEVFGRFLPNRVVAGAIGAEAAAVAGVPLLEGRAPVDGKATAFVCRNYACELPVTDPAALARQLGDQ